MANIQQSATATAQGPIEQFDAIVIGAGVRLVSTVPSPGAGALSALL